ncbi:MAG: hypothetical protein Q9225_004595 [Loekoesia sp. 1 TL-2023]
MNAVAFPDWRRIERRIGKKLRDVLDPRPTVPGPSAEERRAQRLRDALVGLVYFDTFGEIESWTSTGIDPIHQANQPLLRRIANVHDQYGPKTRLLLCHDYKGGYHDYESVRPSPLVSIPPPCWTNVAHRHGVRVFGTFLIEPQTLNMERLLMKTNGVYTIAKQLADMACTYGFDGWLVNIEQDAPEAYHDWSRKLVDFLNELRIAIGKQKKVLWYDALTTEGDVYYQNGLTSMNSPYLQATGGLFTNYKWTEKNLAESKVLARELGIATTDVCFGIDVWAQNTDMPGPPRVTYPLHGGGGTNTGLAMSVLSSSGFCTAMFAPAWAYEHFSTSSLQRIGPRSQSSIARQVDESMWTGSCLPEELCCDCRKGKPHHTDFYKNRPIIRYAHEYPAGSLRFFETRFVQAFQPRNDSPSDQRRNVRYWPMLGSQNPLPNLIPTSAKQWEAVNEGPITRVLYGELSGGPQSSLKIFTKLAGCYEEADDQIHRYVGPTDSLQMTTLCLYKLGMPADGTLEATIEVQGSLFEDGIASGIYLSYLDRASGDLTYTTWDLRPNEHVLGGIPIQYENRDLVELGAYMDNGYDRSTPEVLMEITRIVIKPKQATAPVYMILGLHIKGLGSQSQLQKRVAWSWETMAQEDQGTWPEGMPWSQTTGPFSSFTVYVGGKAIGDAYCLEFPLRNDDVEDLGDEVVINVVGHVFGAGEVNSPPINVSRADVIINEKIAL